MAEATSEDDEESLEEGPPALLSDSELDRKVLVRGLRLSALSRMSPKQSSSR